MSKRRETCWRYSRNPDDKNDKKWYILAFVNKMGSCSLTRFKAADGKHLETLLEKGNFQDNFTDWLNPVSFPLRFSHTITLVKARKDGLPECALREIKKQVIELATSALLGILDG